MHFLILLILTVLLMHLSLSMWKMHFTNPSPSGEKFTFFHLRKQDADETLI